MTRELELSVLPTLTPGRGEKLEIEFTCQVPVISSIMPV